LTFKDTQMKFTITAIKPETQVQTNLIYDNETNELTYADGSEAVPFSGQEWMHKAPVTSKSEPLAKSTPRTLKISLGLSCNYECEYCSQRFVPRADETNKDDIAAFMDGLDGWVTISPERIEFWGGEPLVYIKTLKPLAEAMRTKYPHANFSVITNGSLLNPEVNQWLDEMGFGVAISHDGPGQHVRGPDPLQDAESKSAILDLYSRLRPKNRISFNAMINSKNLSRAAIQKFFIELTGDEQVPIGEGGFVDAYDDGGIANSLKPHETIPFRSLSFAELRSGQAACFQSPRDKITSFIKMLGQRRAVSTIGQKCGMDNPDSIAVDLKGNVLTCQNVSSVGIAPNGESHKIGHVSDLAGVKLNTSTHWSKRSGCTSCPVLSLCKGSCMFLEGELWEASCNNAFSDNIVHFAAAIEFLTGYAPIYIDGGIREDRKDIFGFVHGNPHQEKKPFPIPVVAG
jgi:uncharacterized protein